jgi:hypothetical protein
MILPKFTDLLIVTSIYSRKCTIYQFYGSVVEGFFNDFKAFGKKNQKTMSRAENFTQVSSFLLGCLVHSDQGPRL